MTRNAQRKENPALVSSKVSHDSSDHDGADEGGADEHDVETDTEQRAGVVLIQGPTNAGKSTLLNSLLGTKVSIVTSKPHTTRRRVLGVKTVGGTQLIFTDTPGYGVGKAPRRKDGLTGYMESERKGASKEGDVALLVLDVTALKRFGVETELRLALKNVSIPDVIVVNKVDLLEDKAELLPILKEVGDFFTQEVFQATSEGSSETHEEGSAEASPLAPAFPEIIPVSARKLNGIARIERVCLQRMPEAPHPFPDDTLSLDTDLAFAAELVREKAFTLLGRELPYSLAVIPDGWKEDERSIECFLTIAVERESQKGIVVGKKGAMIGAIGTQAREELEKLLGKKVILKLHAKVVERWSEDVRGLARVGIER